MTLLRNKIFKANPYTAGHLLLGVLMCVSCSVFSQKTKAPKFGKGLLNLVGQDSTWSMKMAARIQLLGTAKWDGDGKGNFENPVSSVLIRRARLKFDGFAYHPRLTYKIELGLSNNDLSGASSYTSNAPRYILDAVIMWNFYKNFVLWIGQTKLPGNIERVISSGNLQQVGRSLLNSRFNIDRDVGVQLRHHFYLFRHFLVREKFAFSQGEGRNITRGNLGGYQYTLRIEILPFGEFKSRGEYSGSDLKREDNVKLMVAATYDMNRDAVKNRSNQGSYMTNDVGFYKTHINTFFLDLMLKYKGFSFMGEYTRRHADDPVAKNSDGTTTDAVVQVGSGLNLQTGYLFKNNWEASGRYTHILLDENITDKKPETQYTLGLSKYIVGHKLKVQTDASYLTIERGEEAWMYRLQVDLHF